MENDDASILSGMSQPFLVDQSKVTNNNDPSSATSTHTSNKIRQNFLLMSTLFAINHGCTVACLGLSNARLGSIGIWSSGTLYASYTISALFGASYFVKRYKSKIGLILGMALSASYVTSFFLSLVIVELNNNGGGGSSSSWGLWLRDFVAIAGALVGGAGSSILWVSQGSYFATSSKIYARLMDEPVEDITGRFGGNFAFVFLLFEVILRLLSTLFIETAGLSWKIIFGLYSLLSILPVMFMAGIMDLERCHETLPCGLLRSAEEDGGDDDGIVQEDDEAEEDDNNDSSMQKATAALKLLRKDPKSDYLAPVNILFGLSSSFVVSVLNGEVVKIVLSDPNSTYVGLLTAVTSMVAALASLIFGRMEASHGRAHCGKEVVMTLGALSYLAIGLIFLAFPSGSEWNIFTLLSVYMLLGIGRSTYEGTLRAIYADFFPHDKEGAFGNIILFSGTASTIGYILSVSSILQCDEARTYCLKYTDGSTHYVLVMELVIITTAVIAIPSFWKGVRLFRKEQTRQHEMSQHD